MIIYVIDHNDDTGAETATIAIVGRSDSFAVDSNHESYKRILEFCSEHRYSSGNEDYLVDTIRSMIDSTESVGKRLRRISDRVTFDGENILFDGDVIKNELTSDIIRAIKEDNQFGEVKGKVENPDRTLTSLVRFMEKVYDNRIESSRESLFDFISACGLKLTKDGNFVGFKAVNRDYGSIARGPGIVNNVSYKDNVSLDNSIGNTVEIARSNVVLDRNTPCASGLHVGTYEYAAFSYGGQGSRVITVEVDPRDVISVPYDYNCQKMRVCRYSVIGEINPGERDSSWGHDDRLLDRWDDDDEYDWDDDSGNFEDEGNRW